MADLSLVRQNPSRKLPPGKTPTPKGIFSWNRKKGGEPNESKYAAILVSPSVILIFLLVIIPMFYALYLSLHKVELAAGAFKLLPIGLGNYARLLHDPRFFPTVARTLEFTILRVGTCFVLGLGLALILNEASLAGRILNRLFLIPWALSFVVNGLMWKWMYNADYGIINLILQRLGIIKHFQAWLGSPSTALYAMTFADAWKAIPFVALVLLAGLKSIPEELYESAKVDGAGILHRFFFITLPSLRPVLLVALVIQTMWSVMAFATIWVVTQGGPMDSTMLLNIYAYQQSFMFLNLGYGATLAYVIAAIILMLTIAYMAVLRMED